MRQAVMTAPGVIEQRSAPEPVPSDGEVRLRIRRIGVCGSDVHVNHGTHPFTGYPVVQGHEFSAVVDAVGPGVTGLEPGALVTALPQIVCGACAACLRGDYHICDHLRVRGFQAPGCAQDLMVVPAALVIALPPGFTEEQGAMVEPVAVAVHAVSRATRLSGGFADRTVGVFGAGPIGNLVAQVARSEGAHVFITDVSAFRLDVARQCGLEYAIPAGEDIRGAARSAFAADGLDVAFECAGAQETIDSAVRAVRKGGTVVIVAVFGSSPRVDLGLVQDREITLAGTLMYWKDDYRRAVDLIASGRVAATPLMTAHFPFERYADAYAFIDAERDRCVKVFIDL